MPKYFLKISDSRSTTFAYIVSYNFYKMNVSDYTKYFSTLAVSKVTTLVLMIVYILQKKKKKENYRKHSFTIISLVFMVFCMKIICNYLVIPVIP